MKIWGHFEKKMADRSAILNLILTKINRLPGNKSWKRLWEFKNDRWRKATCRVRTNKQTSKQTNKLEGRSTYLAKIRFSPSNESARRSDTWRKNFWDGRFTHEETLDYGGETMIMDLRTCIRSFSLNIKSRPFWICLTWNFLKLCRMHSST